MANEQPAPNPAPEPVAPQVPAPEPGQQPAAQQPAEQQPNTNLFDSLGDEDKAYLKSQGIEDLSKPENVEKLLKHNLSLKKTSSETAAELARIKSTVTGVPVAEGGESGPAPTEAPSQSTTTELDPVQAFSLASSFATQFPSLKDKLVSGDFYKEFTASGRQLKDATGNINLNGLLAYAKERQEYNELQEKLEKYEKPGAIPDATPTTPSQPADDAPMTKQMATAILYQDPNHPRAEEAKQFLQSSIK